MSVEIPADGLPAEKIFEKLSELRSSDGNWRAGKTWSLVFYAGEDVYDVAKKAYLEYFSENALNPAVFPSLRQMEYEVVKMGASLLGDPQACGNMTSGGSESLLLAVKTARDWARAHRGIDDPEMVLPITAHPALLKAAHYFGVRPVITPVREDFRADVDAIERAIGPKTVLVVASAPQYPHGVVDPIEEIAEVTLRFDIPFHVDACLGGYLLPWVRELGYKVPQFDLSVEGVWSLSADLHKYGFAAKGASTIFYKSREYRKHQFFAYAGWPGGLYGSPSILGTRPGGAIAAAWAVMNYLGREGYLRLARTIMDTTSKLKEAIEATESLFVLGKPHMSVFAFTSRDEEIDITKVGALMYDKGWRLDRQQLPDSLHMMVTPVHAGIVEQFSKDLHDSVIRARSDATKMAQKVSHYGGITESKSQEQLKKKEEAILGFLDALV